MAYKATLIHQKCPEQDGETHSTFFTSQKLLD